MKTVDIYVHASKEDTYDKGEELGLTGDALRMFSFTGYEHKLSYDVDPITGQSTLTSVDGRRLADGYHTFDELYDHRNILFIQLCLMAGDAACWREDYEGWVCLYLQTTKGQVSYHIANKHLPLFADRIQKCGPDFKWDGHTSAMVLERLSP